MFLDGVSRSIHNLYDSIPGKTAPNKIEFIAEITCKAILGYVISDRLSPGNIRFVVLPTIVVIAQIKPSPLRRDFMLFGIGLKINESIFFAKLCRDKPSLEDRFLMFCLAYKAARAATDCFNSVFRAQKSPSQTDKAATQTIYSRALDLLFQSPFLAIRTYYKPGATFNGLALGIIIGRANFYKYVAKELNLDERQIKSSFVRFKGIINFFIPPPVSSASRVAKIWNEWNQMVLSVVTSSGAFYYSFKQGYEIVSFFESLQKHRHPSGSSREQ